MDQQSAISEITLLNLVIRKGYLDADEVERLTEVAREKDLATLDVAYEQGLLDPQQVENLIPLTDPTNFIPDYELLDLLGSGGMGAVYKARQLNLDRIVALKLMKLSDASSATRSQQEARLVARLRHPNIVAAYDYGLCQGRIYLAMELVDGETLQEWITREGPLPERTALLLLRQVTAALSHAGAQGITHRDIKPANLLLTRDDTALHRDSNLPLVKVADFGLARATTNEQDKTRLTLDGSTIGTPSYAAPEQMKDSHVDQRADIYSLGATLFFMLMGRSPYANKSVMQVISAKWNGDTDWSRTFPAPVSQGCSELCAAMTAPDVNERIARYEDVLHRIDDLLEQTTVSTPAPRPDIWASKSKHFLIGGGVLLAALLIVGFVMIPRQAAAPPGPVHVDLIPADRPLAPLFNGVSVPLRGAQSGTWVTAAEDLGDGLTGATVLAGTDGAHEFRLPSGDISYYQLTLSINPLEGAEVTVLLGSSPRQQPAIRLAGNQIIMGLIDGPSGEFRPSVNLVTVAFDQSGDQPHYQQLTILHQPDGWVVSANGTSLGGIHHEQEAQTRTVELLVRNGTAHFSDFGVLQLEPRSGNRPETP
ncbi:serine/threonine-protein kinase [Rubinisphaera margarita]|uniref:serine/threonine-protein kinase n=1 Tax=Rubinisphaera margarita TaxID=2909586 RepID=UPI001EE89824|nr:serine/threonine-protein kinase [Rubinisphaera margarita]MCG6155121.1 serine/threonine protein kinase [Rubinisphaera margarita]